MIEKEMLQGASRKGNLIIATGGGASMDKENMKNLKNLPMHQMKLFLRYKVIILIMYINFLFIEK